MWIILVFVGRICCRMNIIDSFICILVLEIGRVFVEGIWLNGVRREEFLFNWISVSVKKVDGKEFFILCKNIYKLERELISD